MGRNRVLCPRAAGTHGVPQGLGEAVRFVVGVDLGQTADYTAITILEEREKNSYDVRYLERLKNTPYPAIVRRLDHLVRRLPEKPSMAVDATGVGRPVVDRIRDAHLPASV